MDLPKIDASALPDLGDLTGMFGSLTGPAHDDTVVVIMVFVYEQLPPPEIAGMLI